ncbi:MAG TPA: efflux transporter outer membrane subunit [Burkholderiales bacterium]|nr:efflux transporter outer membrane subunit [Burkholderiales bacterium]
MNKGWWVALLFLAGCATTTDYERPSVELPAAWKESGPRYAQDGKWWRIYGDAQLDGLVEEAFAKNADLAIAVARVDEARALIREAESGYLPTIDARGGASRQQISTRTATVPPGAPREFSSYRGTLNVSYELDLFGRVRAGARAAQAEFEASEAAREGVRTALAAEVAKSYFTLRALDEQVQLTRESIGLREDALNLQRKRREAGITSEFEFRQLEAEAAALRTQLPPLERQREAEEAALSVLLGRTPREVFEASVARKAASAEQPGPLVVPSGMPSELLLRRPDLVEAERRLAAGNARIAAARAEMFPSIALTAALGGESASLSNLFSSGAGIWSLGLALTQPIFAGGRLEARTEAAEARERQLVAAYRKAIQAAFSETRAAISAQARARESYDAETARADALTETARLARLRYTNGIASQLDVIDAERGLLAARSARIEALRQYRAAVADLFRALGG